MDTLLTPEQYFDKKHFSSNLIKKEDFLSYTNDIRDLLLDAAIQIDYLQNKFEETGSGNAILTRIAARTGIKL